MPVLLLAQNVDRSIYRAYPCLLTIVKQLHLQAALRSNYQAGEPEE
jgi:hypothetical protein